MKRLLLLAVITALYTTGCEQKTKTPPQKTRELREVTREELREQQELLDNMQRPQEFDIEDIQKN